MKSARTRHSALSILVSLSVAGSVFAGASSASMMADDFPDLGSLVAAEDAGAVVLHATRALSSVRSAGLGFGDLAIEAGLVFQLPEGASSAAGLDLDMPAWFSEDDRLFIAALSQAVVDASELSLGELVAAASDLAVTMGGDLAGFSVYDNEGVSVYAYDVQFGYAGTDLRGSIGFVPVGDGSLSALTCLYRASDAPTVAPVIARLYESVDVA